jgi:hypothetical protein
MKIKTNVRAGAAISPRCGGTTRCSGNTYYSTV